MSTALHPASTSLLQSVFINSTDDSYTDNIEDLSQRSRGFTTEETKATTAIAKIDTLNDTFISSIVVTLAFWQILSFNLDVELGDFILVILAAWFILNAINIYITIHASLLVARFGVPFTNTITKGFYFTTQAVFFYGLNILKPIFMTLILNPVYVVFMLWLYIGFWEIFKDIISNKMIEKSKAK